MAIAIVQMLFLIFLFIILWFKRCVSINIVLISPKDCTDYQVNLMPKGSERSKGCSVR